MAQALIPITCAVVWVGLAAAEGPGPDGVATWKAGVARAVITPTTPVWLAGYGSKRVPDGALHDP